MNAVALPSYPSRPISVGRWEIASKVWWPRQEQGKWHFQMKLNGWRAIVHCPTGTMFNRHGERLSIAKEFSEALDKLKSSPFFWLDCEALERRHSIGKGSLIVLDWMVDGLADHCYRRAKLEDHFGSTEPSDMTGENEVHLIAEHAIPGQVWDEAKALNAKLGCEFTEGLIGRKVDACYSFQLNTPDKETAAMIKSRWRF